MARFDVYRNPVVAARGAYPLVIALQSDMLPVHADIVVAPLAPRRQLPGVAGRLAPIVQVDDEEYVVLVRSLTHLPARDLARRAAHLAQYRESLLGAVDLLFYGV